MSHQINVGDTVAYSERFLDRHSHYFSAMPSAQGTVNALHCLDGGIILADIEWNKPGLPKRVNVNNLTRAQAPPSGDSSQARDLSPPGAAPAPPSQVCHKLALNIRTWQAHISASLKLHLG
jgi:hypothetical protein